MTTIRLQDRVADLILTQRATRCNNAVAEILGIVLDEDGEDADEAHRYLCDEFGIVRDGAGGVRRLVPVA